MNDVYSEAVDIFLDHPPFLVLTGAGISVESGLPPFRGPGGIWTRYDPEEYGHIDTFRKDPERAWVLLGELISASLNARPNNAHFALARLQEKGIAGTIITQNVDGLHRSAGSVDVLDVHGDARRSTVRIVDAERRSMKRMVVLQTPYANVVLTEDLISFSTGNPFRKRRSEEHWNSHRKDPTCLLLEQPVWSFL